MNCTLAIVVIMCVGFKIIQDIWNEERHLLYCFPSLLPQWPFGVEGLIVIKACRPRCLWVVTPLVQWGIIRCIFLIGQFSHLGFSHMVRERKKRTMLLCLSPYSMSPFLRALSLFTSSFLLLSTHSLSIYIYLSIFQVTFYTFAGYN